MSKIIILVLLFRQSICGQNVKHKNILFLVADDLRPNLGCYKESNFGFKSPPMHTPNIDTLATRSVLFERAYVQESLCSPSRSSSLTGRRPDTTRVHDLQTYFRHAGGNFTTIPQYFKEQGYRSLGMGKIFHPGPASDNDDPISWSEEYYHAPENYPGPWKPEGGSYTWLALNATQSANNPQEDTVNTDHALTKLRQLALDGDKPFFLALGLTKPHLPFVFPEEFLEYYPMEEVKVPENPFVPFDMPDMAWDPILELRMFQDGSNVELGIEDLGQINVTLPSSKIRELRRAYYSAVSYADHQLGRVLNELDRLGLGENTIIIFSGDHGFQIGEHAEWGKQTNFEIAARAPLLIHVPGYKATKTEKLVEFVDIFPTLVEAAGFDPLETCPSNSNEVRLCSEGSSLMPLIKDSKHSDWKEAVFWQYPRGTMVNHTCMGYSVMTSQYHYTEWVHITRLGGYNYTQDWNNACDYGELYDLKSDPREDENLFRNEQYAEMVEVMGKKLRAGWRQELKHKEGK